MATKKVRLVLPAGTARWPKLNTPDVFQPKDKRGNPKGDPKVRWTAGVYLSDEDLERVKRRLIKVAEDEGYDDTIKLPIKTDKKSGKQFIEAASGVDYKPLITDAKQNKIPDDVEIGGGTTYKLDVSVNVYPMQDGGINLYLNAVQVLKLVQPERGTLFEDEDGYVYSGNSNASNSDEAEDMDSDTEEDNYKF